MNNLAQRTEPLQPELEYGRVMAGEKGVFVVRGGLGLVRAEVAASCLVQPAAGDQVLLVSGPGRQAYILSVLKRNPEGASPTRLVFDGQVDLEVNGGGLNLAAEKDLRLASGAGMDLAADKLAVHAGKAEAVIQRINLVAGVFKGQVKRIRTVAGSVENVFRRLTQRLKDSFRFVEDQEEVQAGSARYLVEDTLTMNCGNAVHMAEEMVTINAEQINLG